VFRRWRRELHLWVLAEDKESKVWLRFPRKKTASLAKSSPKGK